MLGLWDVLVGWYLCLKTSCFQVSSTAGGHFILPQQNFQVGTLGGVFGLQPEWCARGLEFFWGFFFLTVCNSVGQRCEQQFGWCPRICWQDNTWHHLFSDGNTECHCRDFFISNGIPTSKRWRFVRFATGELQNFTLVNHVTKQLICQYDSWSLITDISKNHRKDMWHENKSNPWEIWKEINIDQHKPQGFAVVGPLKSGQARHIVDFRDGSWYREDVYDFLRYPGWRLKVWKVSMVFFPRYHEVNIWWAHDPLVFGEKI